MGSIMDINWDERECKREHRQFIFSKLPKPPEVYLTLPGNTYSDLKTGLSNGYLTPSTIIVAAERDAGCYAHVEEFLSVNFKKYRLARQLNELKDFPAVDLAYLDFTGNLTEDTIAWIKKLLRNITDGARICINVTSGYRGNRTVPSIIEFFKTQHYELFLDTQRHLMDKVQIPGHMLEYVAAHQMYFEMDLFTEYNYKLIIDHYKETFSPHHMVTFIVNGIRPKNNLGEIPMAVASASEYVDKFLAAPKTYDSMRGLKASLTKFCEKKERETGTPARRFRAAVKAVITRKGGDSTEL